MYREQDTVKTGGNFNGVINETTGRPLGWEPWYRRWFKNFFRLN